jgi:hypothetical protein
MTDELCPQCGGATNSDHWKRCPQPTPDEAERRIRYGLVPDHIPASFSWADRYDDCPRWWKLEQDTHLRTGHPMADVGHDLHGAIEARYLGEPPPPPTAPLSAWAESVEARKLAASMALDLEDLVGTEKHGGQLSAIYPMVGQQGQPIWVHFMAVIDRLHISADGRGRIVDYKNGWQVPKLVDDDPQGLTYAVIALENFPWLWEFTFSQYQTRYDDAKTVTFDLEKVRAFRSYLLERIQGIILDTQHKPNPSPILCRLCPFALNHCKAGKEMVGELGTIQSVQDLERYGQVTIVVDAKTDILKNTMKAAMERLEVQAVELPAGTWSIEKVSGRFGPYTKLLWKNRPDETKRKRFERSA